MITMRALGIRLACLLAVAWCWTAATAAGGTLVVGSKRFTESYILGEIVRQTLAEAGIAAEHRQGLGNTGILEQALASGAVDVYPEYTGTIVRELLQRQDAQPSLDELNRWLAPRGLKVAVSLGFNNSYALAMRESVAQRLGVRRISDLALLPPGALKMGLSHEFQARADGWPALQRAYALPQAPGAALDHGLAYEAVQGGQVDLIDVYTTDAKVGRYRLRVLDDDRRFFPRYDAVLLMRAAVDARPLQRLAGRIDEAAMVALNAQVELDGVSFAEAARRFLARDAGLAGMRAGSAPSDIRASSAPSSTRAGSTPSDTRAGSAPVDTRASSTPADIRVGSALADTSAGSTPAGIRVGSTPADTLPAGTPADSSAAAPAREPANPPAVVRPGFVAKLLAPDLAPLMGQHLALVLGSLLLAVVVGVPLGVVAWQRPRLAAWLLSAVGVLQTVPSLALLAFLIALLGRIGFVPAVLALFLYALLPIVRNTHAGLAGVPSGLALAASALGLTPRQALWAVQLPLARPTLLAGVKTAAVINVGTATVAAFIGAGGLGERIVAGLAVNDRQTMLAGALPAALLALAVQWLFDAWEGRSAR